MLEDVLAWPAWWPGVLSVEEIAPGHERRVGAVYRTRWRGWAPYTVGFDFTVEGVDRPRAMHGTARGDLEGRGAWRLFEDGGVTVVTYEWEVTTRRPWMDAVAPLLRPALRSNHDRVMSQGGEALARSLGARLLAGG